MMLDVKKISLELSMEDYVTLTIALDRARGYYQQEYKFYDGLDDKWAERCDLRLSCLERLSHMVEQGGVWCDRD